MGRFRQERISGEARRAEAGLAEIPAADGAAVFHGNLPPASIAGKLRLGNMHRLAENVSRSVRRERT